MGRGWGRGWGRGRGRGRGRVLVGRVTQVLCDAVYDVTLYATALDAALGINIAAPAWISITLHLVGRTTIGAAFNVLYVHTPETMPTELRATGMSVPSTCARVGGILAPYLALIVSTASSGVGRGGGGVGQGGGGVGQAGGAGQGRAGRGRAGRGEAGWVL